MAGNRMVGMTGFEPATSCSQSRRATKLRHIPTLHSGIDYSRRIEIRPKDFRAIGPSPSLRPCPFPPAPALPCGTRTFPPQGPFPAAASTPAARALLVGPLSLSLWLPPFPSAPALRASLPNEIGGPLTTFNPIHQGHHNHSHIRTTFFYVKYHLTGYTEYTVSNCT